MLGILHTRDGDYIQQYGISGTDILATTKIEREINRDLNELFGGGFDWRMWRENIKHRLRLHGKGLNLLIDYQDASRTKPNCLKTFFGHGIYTKYETMLFNTRKICEHFY